MTTEAHKQAVARRTAHYLEMAQRHGPAAVIELLVDLLMTEREGRAGEIVPPVKEPTP